MSLLPKTVWLWMLPVLALAGCARLGEPLNHELLPPDAPTVGDILASLAENEAGIASFRATGTVVLQSPELESTQISRESTILYRNPLDLHVIGRKYGTRFVELTCSGEAFLIQFPTERQFYYRPAGERFQTVSTSEMAREMFQPEAWGHVSPARVRVLAYDAAAQTVDLVILDRRGGAPRRWLRLQGSPWVVLENHLLDPDGRELAVTVKSEYYVKDGIRFPGRVESAFPGENARMSFALRKMDLNPPVEGQLFDLKRQAHDLERRGFEQVETLRNSGGGGEGGFTEAGQEAAFDAESGMGPGSGLPAALGNEAP
ncbi:MAG: hypothetical protein GXY15_13600 [Candidatus Hydrogenedentes bacterium]|nr:hypothetical protein [Candidatus Hydrogenedentota bacterium]